MNDKDDNSLEPQMQRNLASDLRISWGCQLSMLLFALLGLIPLGALFPFTERIDIVYGVAGLFYTGVALAANRFRRRSAIRCLGRSTAAWLLVVATGGALIFYVLAASQMFGI